MCKWLCLHHSLLSWFIPIFAYPEEKSQSQNGLVGVVTGRRDHGECHVVLWMENDNNMMHDKCIDSCRGFYAKKMLMYAR